MFAPDYSYDTHEAAAPFDRMVAAACVMAEVAFGVFGMLFWSAVGLFAARAFL